MGKITRLNLSWTLILALLLLILFSSRGALVPLSGMPQSDMLLGALIDQFAQQHAAAALLLGAMIVLWNSMLLVRIVSRNMIQSDRNYLPITLYTLVAAGCFFQPSMLATLIVSALLIGSFGYLLSSFRRIVQYSELFQASLLCGITPLIYSHTVIYLLLLPVALILFRKTGREWIVAWCGYLLPLFFCSYVYWGMGHSFFDLIVILYNNLLHGSSALGMPHPANVWLLILFGVCALGIILLAIVVFWQRAATLRTRAYKSYQFFLWVLLLSAVLLALPSRSALDLPLIAIPFGVLGPLCLLHYNHWAYSVLFALLPLSLIVYNLLVL